MIPFCQLPFQLSDLMMGIITWVRILLSSMSSSPRQLTYSTGNYRCSTHKWIYINLTFRFSFWLSHRRDLFSSSNSTASLSCCDKIISARSSAASALLKKMMYLLEMLQTRVEAVHLPLSRFHHMLLQLLSPSFQLLNMLWLSLIGLQRNNIH